jgi:hypothetical protein
MPAIVGTVLEHGADDGLRTGSGRGELRPSRLPSRGGASRELDDALGLAVSGYITLELAALAMPRQQFAQILSLITRTRAHPAPA